MSNIFIFPGQGSQKVGMGNGFIETFDWAKDMFEEAGTILGYDIIRLISEGPEEELKRTVITQPAVYMTEIVIHESVRKRGVEAVMTAGHSLGEYAAVVASGALDWRQGLELVRFRGEIFEETGHDNPGTMAAVIGLDEDIVNEIIERMDGICEVVNYNSPGQLVISMEKDKAEGICGAIKEAGAKMVVPLEVSGAFHSSLMNAAVGPMKDKIDSMDFREPAIPVYANVTGQAVSSADEIKECLIRQVNSPVKWVDIVHNMSKQDPEAVFLELGPGKVLQGLIKRIDRKLRSRGVSVSDDLEALIV